MKGLLGAELKSACVLGANVVGHQPPQKGELAADPLLEARRRVFSEEALALPRRGLNDRILLFRNRVRLRNSASGSCEARFTINLKSRRSSPRVMRGRPKGIAKPWFGLDRSKGEIG